MRLWSYYKTGLRPAKMVLFLVLVWCAWNCLLLSFRYVTRSSATSDLSRDAVVGAHRLSLHCVSKKRHPIYFSENLAKYYPISIIFGSSIPEEICNKSLHVYPPHLFTKTLIPYLVKIMIHLPVFTCFKKWPFYCVQQVSQMPSEFHNFSRYTPE